MGRAVGGWRRLTRRQCRMADQGDAARRRWRLAVAVLRVSISRDAARADGRGERAAGESGVPPCASPRRYASPTGWGG